MPPIKALIFVEGDTEEEVFDKIFQSHLRGISKKIINLHGNRGLHRKILGQTLFCLQQNPSLMARVYCFIDREGRRSVKSPLDLSELRKSFATNPSFKQKVLSADAVIATQTIESWLFHDIEGIYRFLRMPHNKRKPNHFKFVEKFNHIDLAKLFKESGQGHAYIKGKRCRNFVDHLDLGKIYDNCPDLQNGLTLIRRHFNR